MNKLEQLMLASIASDEGSITESLYEYKSLFISRVFPDKDNPRYFPAVIMTDEDAYQVALKKISKRQLIERYSAENKVVLGKGCIVNCCMSGSNEWKKCNQTITSIIELGENIAVSEVIQTPTVFPLDNGNYQILTGHRRFFAMIYAKGVNGAAHFKVYHDKPLLYKVKQFQENASREDLPQYGKLQAFQAAIQEIETYNSAKSRVGQKPLTVRQIVSTLGISGGAYDNYNVLVRYPAVIKSYENGSSLPFIKMKKIVLEAEKKYKSKHEIKILNVTHKREINKIISSTLTDSSEKYRSPKNYYTFGKVDSPDVIKKLLSENMFSLNTDVDWNLVEWNEPESVNNALEKLLEYLNSGTKKI